MADAPALSATTTLTRKFPADSGVPVETIVHVAEVFAHGRPGLAVGGGMAVTGSNATSTQVAINLLNAAAGLRPEVEPRDAPWGERYFHLTDPDGHELSFARPLLRANRTPP